MQEHLHHAMLYQLAPPARARGIFESGIGTLRGAAAVRDQGEGMVIGTECVPAKIAAPRAHVEEAGLTPVEGDATRIRN